MTERSISSGCGVGIDGTEVSQFHRPGDVARALRPPGVVDHSARPSLQPCIRSKSSTRGSPARAIVPRPARAISRSGGPRAAAPPATRVRVTQSSGRPSVSTRGRGEPLSQRDLGPQVAHGEVAVENDGARRHDPPTDRDTVHHTQLGLLLLGSRGAHDEPADRRQPDPFSPEPVTTCSTRGRSTRSRRTGPRGKRSRRLSAGHLATATTRRATLDHRPAVRPG